MDNNEMKKKALNLEELEQASGGTFMPNKYSVEEYKSGGITCVTHMIDKDEFWWNGKDIGHDNANTVMLFQKVNGHEPVSVEEANAFREKWENINRYDKKGA